MVRKLGRGRRETDSKRHTQNTLLIPLGAAREIEVFDAVADQHEKFVVLCQIRLDLEKPFYCHKTEGENVLPHCHIDN